MKTIESKKADAEYTEVSFKLPKGSEAATQIPKLLALLAYLGDVGASRSIVVNEAFDLSGGAQDYKTGFDGDGSDRIIDLQVDGKPFKCEKDFYKGGEQPKPEGDDQDDSNEGGDGTGDAE
jgi:hypothetical protein